jgi:TRAP-type mannitol/chloroaromatic compound transport system permease small subunit
MAGAAVENPDLTTAAVRGPRQRAATSFGARCHCPAAGLLFAAEKLGARRNLVSSLLSLSRLIDRLNERIGHAFYWLVLATVLISAANAVVRKVFNYSSNAFLEIQWYLFSLLFLFLAGYTLLRNEHVRIDVIAGRLSKRAQTWIDILGTLFFLLPMAILLAWLAWPVFVEAFERHEISTNAGGLIIWPARLIVPIGFALLALQGLSELIKRIAFLQGLIPDPSEKHAEKTLEEQLAEEIVQARGDQQIAEDIERTAQGRADKP